MEKIHFTAIKSHVFNDMIASLNDKISRLTQSVEHDEKCVQFHSENGHYFRRAFCLINRPDFIPPSHLYASHIICEGVELTVDDVLRTF